MKLVPPACAVLALLGGWLGVRGDDQRVVILSGDTQGYLSPCGCTSPMMGGIRRRASAIKAFSIPGRTTLLENGGFVSTAGRQDEMKAETIAQAMSALGVTAINIGPADGLLGRGILMQAAQLSGGKLLTGSLSHPESISAAVSISDGPFLIGGATDAPQALASPLADAPLSLQEAVKNLVTSADQSGLRPILMLQGGYETAASLAREFPSLALIQYSSVGNPPAELEYIGDTALATTGEHGKHIVRLIYRNEKFEQYRSIALGPQYKDDPVISRYYAAYLRRVKGEKLLEKVARKTTAAYAGSWACASCHAGATRVWKLSAHRHGFDTLIKAGHDFDPDCVGCHVVALDSTKGFRSLAATPHLAGIGCESCHGPALLHARSPKRWRLERATNQACIGCHNPQNSPNFEFDAYWRKISHH